MLIARPRFRGFRVIDCFSQVTYLGEGMTVTGRLSDLAMDRTLATLRICAEKLHKRNVSETRLVATEACRRAANHAAFAARITAETGLHLDIIPAREEASLALAGCASLLTPALPWVFAFDIGGGSTELVWGSSRSHQPKLRDMCSFPFGVVTLTESLGETLNTEAGYQSAVAMLVAEMKSFDEQHRISHYLATGRARMVGTSGTITTLAAVHLGLERYDRALVDGLTVDMHDIAAVILRLRRMSLQERLEHPCLGPHRADLVIAGCAVLEAVCRLWPTLTLRVADRGVREGVLLAMMNGNAPGRPLP